MEDAETNEGGYAPVTAEAGEWLLRGVWPILGSSPPSHLASASLHMSIIYRQTDWQTQTHTNKIKTTVCKILVDHMNLKATLLFVFHNWCPWGVQWCLLLGFLWPFFTTTLELGTFVCDVLCSCHSWGQVMLHDVIANVDTDAIWFLFFFFFLKEREEKNRTSTWLEVGLGER